MIEGDHRIFRNTWTNEPVEAMATRISFNLVELSVGLCKLPNAMLFNVTVFKLWCIGDIGRCKKHCNLSQLAKVQISNFVVICKSRTRRI